MWQPSCPGICASSVAGSCAGASLLLMLLRATANLTLGHFGCLTGRKGGVTEVRLLYQRCCVTLTVFPKLFLLQVAPPSEEVQVCKQAVCQADKVCNRLHHIPAELPPGEVHKAKELHTAQHSTTKHSTAQHDT